MSREDNTNEPQLRNVKFKKTDGSIINFVVPSDISIENLIRTYKNKTSIDLNHYIFLYNSQKIDINSQLKFNEFFDKLFSPTIIALDY